MRNRDILNAIDEIDLKYVTQAWENTTPPTDEPIRLNDKRRVNFAAIGAGAAAVILAGFVTMTYMRGGLHLPTNSQNSNTGITPGVSVSDVTSENSGETSENSRATTSKAPENSDSTVSVPNNDSNVSVPETESNNTSADEHDHFKGELYAPDKQTFTYECGDGSRLEMSGDTPTVVFDNFVYLGSPQNIYNSISNPDFFVTDSDAFGGAGVLNKAMLKLYKQEVPYKRYYVGDKYGDLTLASAKTVFIHGGLEEARGNNLVSMVAEFEGTTKLPVIIYYYDGVYFAIPFGQNIPGGGKKNIPAMSFLETEWGGEYTTKGAFTPISSYLQAYSDVVIRLNNPEEFGLADMISDDKGFAIAVMELGNVHVEYNPASSKRDVDLTTATIKSAETTPIDWSASYKKTTDAHTTIENYFRDYVIDSTGKLPEAVNFKLLSVKETTKSVEEIRENLIMLSSNPDSSPLNPDCAELIHDYEVVYNDGEKNVTATVRLIYDKGETCVWAVVSSREISREYPGTTPLPPIID